MESITKVFSDLVKPYIDTKNQILINEVDTIFNELGAKNLLPFNLAYIVAHNTNTHGTWSGNNYTLYGITFTINDDGTITADGTPTAAVTLNLGSFNVKAGTAYTLTDGIGTLKKDTTASLYVTSSPSQGGSWWWRTDNNSPEGHQRVATVDAVSTAHIRIFEGATVSNLIFKPMFRFASIIDGTYEPYAKTNQQLTKDTDFLVDNAETVGAVNILINEGITQVSAGITWTVNDDGTVTADGTQKGQSTFHVVAYNDTQNILPAGTYKFTCCPPGGAPSGKWRAKVFTDGGSTTLAEEYGEGAVFTLTTPTQVSCLIRFDSASPAQTVSNMVFKPMITVPNYNGEYIPSALSNKSLTDRLLKLSDRFILGFQVRAVGSTARNVTKTITANANTRGFLGIWHPTDTAMGSDALYMIEIRAGGVVWAKPIVEGSGITIDTSQTGQLSFTNVGSGSVYPYLILIAGDVAIS